MRALGIDIDRNGRVWTSDGTSIYSKNKAYIIFRLKEYLETNSIDRVYIEDDSIMSYEFKRDNNWMIAVIKIAQKYLKKYLISVHPKFTSMRCSMCGFITNVSRKTKTKFECEDCGFKSHADLNAAKNILFYGLQKELYSSVK